MQVEIPMIFHLLEIIILIITFSIIIVSCKMYAKGDFKNLLRYLVVFSFSLSLYALNHELIELKLHVIPLIEAKYLSMLLFTLSLILAAVFAVKLHEFSLKYGFARNEKNKVN